MLPSLRGARKHYVNEETGNRIDVLLTKFCEFLIGEMEKEKCKYFGEATGVDDSDNTNAQKAIKQSAYSLDNRPYVSPRYLSPYLQSDLSRPLSRPSSRCSSVTSSSRFTRRGRSHHSLGS